MKRPLFDFVCSLQILDHCNCTHTIAWRYIPLPYRVALQYSTVGASINDWDTGIGYLTDSMSYISYYDIKHTRLDPKKQSTNVLFLDPRNQPRFCQLSRVSQGDQFSLLSSRPGRLKASRLRPTRTRMESSDSSSLVTSRTPASPMPEISQSVTCNTLRFVRAVVVVFDDLWCEMFWS